LKAIEHADLHRILFEQWEDFGGFYPAKFVDGKRTNHGYPWSLWEWVGVGALPETHVLDVIKTANADTTRRYPRRMTWGA